MVDTVTPEPGSASGEAGGRVLLERRRALAAIARAAAQAERGRSRVVVVAGPVGSGRSAVLDEACDALGPSWSVRAAAPPSGAVSDGPVAVLVDDADDAPPDVVADVVAAVVEGRVGLAVLAVRTGASLGDAVAAASPVAVDLHPLSPGAVAALCAAAGVALDPGPVHHRTGGLAALVAALVDAPDERLPPAAVRHLRRALRPLGDEARSLAELLAAAPRPVPVDVAERAVTPAAVVALRDAGLVRDVDDGVVLDPPLLGELLHGDLATGQRAMVLRHLARCWMLAPDPCPATIGALLVGAGDSRGARAFLLRAADVAVRSGDPAAAVARYLDAQRTGDLEPDHLVAGACAAAAIGRPALAQRWARQAEVRLRAGGDGAGASRVWQHPELAYVRRDAVAEAPPTGSPGHLAAEAEAAARRREPGCELLADLAAGRAADADDDHALSTAGVALLLAGRHEASRRIHQDLRDRAARVDDHLAEAAQLRALSRIALSLGDPLAALLHARAAVAAAERAAGSVPAAFQRIHLAAVLTLTGDLDEAARIAEPLADDPDPTVAAIAAIPLAGIDLGHGRPARALERLAPLLPHRDAAGPDAFSGILLQVAEAHVQDGDHERARAVLDELDGWVGGHLEPTRADQLALAGRIAAREGDTATLVRLAAEARAMTSQPAPALVAVTQLLTGLALRGRDDVAAATHLGDAAVAAVRAPRAGLALTAWLDAAEAWAAAGRPVDAAGALDEARRLADGCGIGAEDERLARLAASTGAVAGVHLTPRERSLLGLLTEGCTNRQMADRLHLAEKTVRNQLSTLFVKLGVERRSQAAVLASQLGIAPPPAEGCATGADDVPAPVRPCGPAARRR